MVLECGLPDRLPPNMSPTEVFHILSAIALVAMVATVALAMIAYVLSKIGAREKAQRDRTRPLRTTLPAVPPSPIADPSAAIPSEDRPFELADLYDPRAADRRPQAALCVHPLHLRSAA
jgi:hypothetical protein